MTRPRVAVGSLGGTITMTSDDLGGLRPTLSAAELLSAVPGLDAIASLEAVTLAGVSSASLGYDEVLAALAWARRAVDGGAAGVVVVQGTDTLEETAYLLDLLWNRPAPLVLTAAMRAPQRPGSDGPANLWAAVTVAAHPQSRDIGVIVVMNDEVHAASRVTKSDSMSVDAFRSPVFGVLGRVVEQRPVYGNRPLRHCPLPEPAVVVREPRVALLTSHLADPGDLIRLVADAGYDGVVLAALGVGHVSESAAVAVSEVTGKMAVIVATRTGAGPTAQHTYAFPGSETDLVRRGATVAGWLAPIKARVLLWALLRQDCTPVEVQAEFARRGQMR